MPIIKSAKKALRQNSKHRTKNLSDRSKLKNLLKEVRKLAEQKRTDEAKKLLPAVFKSLDKSAKTGQIKKNTAARYKSRIDRLIARQS